MRVMMKTMIKMNKGEEEEGEKEEEEEKEEEKEEAERERLAEEIHKSLARIGSEKAKGK